MKSKWTKLLVLVLAVVMCLSVGILAACDPEQEETTHNWDTEWSPDATDHWHKCLDLNCTEISDKAAHSAPNADGKCTVCGYQLTTVNPNPTPDPDPDPTPVTKEVVVYFYNYNEWTLGVTAKDEDGEDVLDGATFTAVEEHAKWYTVTVPVDANKVNFTLEIKNTAEGATDEQKVTLNVTENATLYISENGTDYEDFAAAEAKPPVPMTTTKVHILAPSDWTKESGVAIYVYGAGEFFGAWPSAANTHADPDHEGWLVAEAELPLADAGKRVTFILFDVENNDEQTGEGRLGGGFDMNADVYVTSDGKVFDTYADAEKYIGGEAPEGKVYVTVHVQVVFGAGGIPVGSDVYLYSWGTPNDQFGGWPGTKLEEEKDADGTGTGWYTARILIDETWLANKNFNLIVNNNDGSQYDLVKISQEWTEYWVSADGTPSEAKP